jgi:hypothetical protein
MHIGHPFERVHKECACGGSDAVLSLGLLGLSHAHFDEPLVIISDDLSICRFILAVSTHFNDPIEEALLIVG